MRRCRSSRYDIGLHSHIRPDPYRSHKTVVEQLRDILEREGIRRSRSADQDGIFFVIEGGDEVSLRYNLPEDRSGAPTAASFGLAMNDVLKCGKVIADAGFAVTLILSSRTCAVFVSTEGEPH